MKKRTDVHRPSAIVAADYEHLDSYFTWISFGTQDCQDYPEGESDMEVFSGIPEEALFGGLPDGILIPCDVCGARHKHGSLFLHRPSQVHVKMGHDCARKYNLAMRLVAGRQRVAAMRCRKVAYIMRMERRAKLREFVAQYWNWPMATLLTDLRTKHHVIQDIRRRVIRHGAISDKQQGLVEKIAREERERVIEVHVPAPIADGRQCVEGVIVSCKSHEGPYGDSMKMTVKVQAEGGTWLCWGTAPDSLLDEAANLGGLRGCRVKFFAKLAGGGEDEHFAFFKRPTKAVLLKVGKAGEEKLREVLADIDDCGNYHISPEYVKRQLVVADRLTELTS